MTSTTATTTRTTFMTLRTAPERIRVATRMLLASAALAATLAVAAPARADFGVAPGTFTVTTSTTRAGAHPDLTTTFSINTHEGPFGPFGPPDVDGRMKDIQVDLPAGVVGTPAGIPQCPAYLVVTGCPASTQIGMVYITSNFGFTQPAPLYNLVPKNGATSEFGFLVFGSPQVLRTEVRPGDAGLRVTLKNMFQQFQITGTSVVVWGVPADASHDPDRGGAASTVRPRPLLANPTECTGAPLQASITLTSWESSDQSVTDMADMAPVSGCDKMHFEPSLRVAPEVTQADSPSGYDVTIAVPQNQEASGVATAELRKAVVKLPVGVALNPAVATGLEACTDAQFGVGSNGAPSCPGASRIGQTSLTTPALDDDLTGSIYLGQPKPDDPYRLLLSLSGNGVMIKLQGSVEADPVTGQLTTTFDNNPQQPFSELRLHFKGGQRAPLTTPVACGTATTMSELTPWSAPDSGAPAKASDVFAVSWDGHDGACPGTQPFSPGFSAGVTNPVGGAYSPLVFRVTRDDRNQTLGQISDVHLPPGLVAKVAGVALCADAQAAAGTCDAASQIGSAMVASGAGTEPLHLGGKVFLTQGYKGAAFGLSIVVPAIAGPFDLGTVVVRASVNVNSDASLTVDADPLPTMLQGIPLRMRDIVLNLDRSSFMRNPTNCAPSAITAAVQSTAGAVANVSSRFQVGDCAALPFAPRMAMRLTNRSQTTDGKHPGLDVLVTQGAGQANLKQVVAALPLSLALDPKNSQSDALCSFGDGLKDRCPVSSEIGTAEAVSPLLNRHLYGKVYFVKGLRLNSKGQLVRTLPTLLIPLRGEINLDLRATSKVDSEGRLVTTFANIPDAALSGFRLQLRGGKKGILVVTGHRNLCRGKQVAAVQTGGQNGKTRDVSVTMKTPCANAKTRAKISSNKRSKR